MNNEPTLDEMIYNLNAIIYNKEAKTYSLNVTMLEETTVNIKHPVYTGNMAANGTMNTSRKLANIRPTIRRREVDHNFAVDEAIAKAIGRSMRAAGRVGNVVDFGSEIVQYIVSEEVALTDWVEISEQQDEIADDMAMATTFR